MEQASLLESFNIFSGLFFLASTFSLILGIVVLVKNAAEKLNRITFYLCLIICIESLGYALTFWTTNLEDVYLFMGIACIGYCLIWPVSTHYLVEFSFGKVTKGWLVNIIILYAIAIFYIVTWFTGLTASAGYDRIKYGWVDHPNQTIFYYIYIAYTIYGFLCMFIVCGKAEAAYKKNKKNKGKLSHLYIGIEEFNKIKQIRIMFTAGIISATLALIFNIVIPICGIKIPSIGFLFMFIFVFSCSFCMIKYHTFILKKEIAPTVIDNVGEIVLVISEKYDVVYVNDTFFKKLKLENCDPALINLSDILSCDVNQLVTYEDFHRNVKISKEIELLCYDKETRIQTKMVSIPVTLSRKQKVIVLTFSDISHRIKRLKENQDNLLEHLAFAADGKSQDLHVHIYRMSTMTACIAEEYKKKYPECNLPENIEILQKAALFHDIGKISVPDSILNKPGKLTDEEYTIVKGHSLFGYNIMKCMEGKVNEIASLIALNHHENWDGTGYPYKVKGQDIPLVARITSVADVMDALLTNRVYKKAMTKEEVEEFLKNERGKKFDPEIIDIILKEENNYRCFDKLIEIYNSF
ncbi:MAG: HD domain-containing protein [Treponema sp.]|nr:HD domain-containing protein [Treponema sp.]